MSDTASGFKAHGHEPQWAAPRQCQSPPNGLEKPEKKHDATHELGGTAMRTVDPRGGDRAGYRKAQQVDKHGSHIDEARRQCNKGGDWLETATPPAGVITTGGHDNSTESRRHKDGRHSLPAGPPPPPRGPPPHITRRASSHRKAATPEVRRSSDHDLNAPKVRCHQFGNIDAQITKNFTLSGAPQQRDRRSDPSLRNGLVPPPTCSPPPDAFSQRRTITHKPHSTARLHRDRRRSFADGVDTYSISDGGSVRSSNNSSTRCSGSGKGKKHLADGSHCSEKGTDGGQSFRSTPSRWDSQGASLHDRRPIRDRNHRPRGQSRERQSVTDSGEQKLVPKEKISAEDWGDVLRPGVVGHSTGGHRQQGGSCDGRRARSFRNRNWRKGDRSSSPGDDYRRDRKNKWGVRHAPARDDIAPQSADKIHEDDRAGNGRWNIAHQTFDCPLKCFENSRGSAEAWGSESTATPSPRAPRSGSVDEIGGGTTEGVVALLDESINARAMTSCRGDSRAEKRRSPTIDPANPGVLCHNSSTSSLLSAVTMITLREGGRSSVWTADSGGFVPVPAAGAAASDESRASNRKSDSFRRKARRGNICAMKAESPAPSTGRGSRSGRTVDSRRCRGEENRSVSGKSKRHSLGGGQSRGHWNGESTFVGRRVRHTESIPADRTSISTGSSCDGDGSGSIISGRSSNVDDAQTYPGGRDACGHGKPRPVTAGKWFAAEGELEGDAQPSDRYRKDVVVSPEVVANSTPRRESKYDAGNVERDRKNEECDGSEGGAAMIQLLQRSRRSRPNPIMMSYDRGRDSDMVQCVVVRGRSSLNRLYPQYRFFFDGHEGQLMMAAHKCVKNRTSNYHVFDMQRGGFGKRLRKKNGNYLGKVRTNLKRTKATVFTNDQEVAELGAISFERPGIVKHLKEGSQPRKFSVLLPALDFAGAPVAHKVDPFDTDSDLLSCIKQRRHGGMFPLKTRDPTFSKGNYRLNFNGRITVSSVKNFQLISPDDETHTVCQFGKVGEDRFHLDYRASMNAFQAFCISLAQFNF